MNDGQVVGEGQTVQFELRTPTNGQQSDLRFYISFEGADGKACNAVPLFGTGIHLELILLNGLCNTALFLSALVSARYFNETKRRCYVPRHLVALFVSNGLKWNILRSGHAADVYNNRGSHLLLPHDFKNSRT